MYTEEIKAQADQGDLHAKYRIGHFYANGQGVAENPEKAVQYYTIAAHDGHLLAQNALAQCYEKGYGVTKDAQKAFYYYEMAANQGYSDPQYKLALCYENGHGVEKNQAKAVQYYKFAADSGYLLAKNALARCYENGCGVQKNATEAFRYYKMAADQGHSNAQYDLALCYESGYGVQKDETEAFRYYKMAADQGLITAYNNLGICYQYGTGVQKNETEAFRYYKMGAEQGQRNAQYNLALCYATGCGVQKNETEAFRYYKMGAEQGQRNAQYNLALCYATGCGVQKDEKEAVGYYKMAADQGHSNAQYKLACCYQNGSEDIQNEQEAVKYFQKAADQEHVWAQHNLSIRYQIGRGVQPNPDKANFYYKKAINASHLPPQLTSNNSVEEISLNAPSLLLKIFEKESTTTKSLAEHILSLSAEELDKSYILAEPPEARHQRGPTCGLFAFKSGIDASDPTKSTLPVRTNLIKPLTKEKKENEKINSLRKIAKKHGSVTGEIYNMHCLEETAKELGIKTCTLISGDSDSESYIEKIKKSVRTGHYVILPVDVDKKGFPGDMQGQRDTLHYALCWGLIFKNNQYHFLVTHWGKHFLWSALALQASHKQMPAEIAACVQYKDRSRDCYFPIEHDQKVPEKDRRYFEPTSLKDFQFTALEIPSNKKEFLVVRNWNEEKSVYSSVNGTELRFLFNINKKPQNKKKPSQEELTLHKLTMKTSST